MIIVGIIGAGQLGSRYLQGFAKNNASIRFEIVEPSAAAKKTAFERYSEVVGIAGKEIVFYNSVSEMSNVLDVVVIATSADVRYSLLAELIPQKKVKKLVLEKVLFQRKEEFYLAANLLKKTNTPCWVNHPRRMFPFYKDIKNQLKDATELNFTVSGSAWGLACNALHYLDLFAYLTDSSEAVISTKFLDKQLQKSKRASFYELTGMLSGSIGGHGFQINCFNTDGSPVLITISSDKGNFIIDEAAGSYLSQQYTSGFTVHNDSSPILRFQSELSTYLLDDLINSECRLPTYQDSMSLHLQFIDRLIDFINGISDDKFDYCPIT